MMRTTGREMRASLTEPTRQRTGQIKLVDRFSAQRRRTARWCHRDRRDQQGFLDEAASCCLKTRQDKQDDFRRHIPVIIMTVARLGDQTLSALVLVRPVAILSRVRSRHRLHGEDEERQKDGESSAHVRYVITGSLDVE